MIFVLAALGLAGLAAWGWWSATLAIRDIDGIFGIEIEEEDRVTSTTACVFCKIVREESPCVLVKEWDDAMAIVPLNPVVEGHVLVIPKIHVCDALENPFVTAATMRRASELAFAPCNIITSVGAEATQSVFHLHVHIVPRTAGDGLPLPWSNQEKSI